MNQYVITAFDFTDEHAPERRMAARPFHLEKARMLKAQNRFIKGGAMLNDDGKMIGSVMLMQFENEEELETWKQNEPYILQRVWENVEVRPFRVADV